MVGTYKIGNRTVSQKTFNKFVNPRSSSSSSSSGSSGGGSSSSSQPNNQDEISSSFYGKSYSSLNQAQKQQVNSSITQAKQRLSLQGKTSSNSNILSSVNERMTQEAKQRTEQEASTQLSNQQAKTQEIEKSIKVKEQNLSVFQKAQTPLNPVAIPIPTQFLDSKTALTTEKTKDTVTVTDEDGLTFTYDRKAYDKFEEGALAYLKQKKAIRKEEQDKRKEEQDKKIFDLINKKPFAVEKAIEKAEGRARYEQAKAEIQASIFTTEQKDSILNSFKEKKTTPNFLTDTTTSTSNNKKTPNFLTDTSTSSRSTEIKPIKPQTFIDLSLNQDKLKIAGTTKVNRDTIDFVNTNLVESNVFTSRFLQTDTTLEKFRDSPLALPRIYSNERMFQQAIGNIQDFWNKESLKTTAKVGTIMGGMILGSSLATTAITKFPSILQVVKEVSTGAKFLYGSSVALRGTQIVTGKGLSFKDDKGNFTTPQIVNVYEGKPTKRLLEATDLALELATVGLTTRFIKLNQVDTNTYRIDTKKPTLRTQKGNTIKIKEFGKINTKGGTIRDVKTTLTYDGKGTGKYDIKVLGSKGKVLTSTKGNVPALDQNFFTTDGKPIFSGMHSVGTPYVVKTELVLQGGGTTSSSTSFSKIKPITTTKLNANLGTTTPKQVSTGRNIFQSITQTKVVSIPSDKTYLQTTTTSSDVKAQESFSYFMKNAKITSVSTSNQFQLTPTTSTTVNTRPNWYDLTSWGTRGSLAFNPIGQGTGGTGGTGVQPFTNIKPVSINKPLLDTNLKLNFLGQTAVLTIPNAIVTPFALFNVGANVKPISQQKLNVKPLIKLNTQPVTEPLTQPITEPITEPNVQPLVIDNTGGRTQPVTEPITQPIVEPILEPIVTPIIAPISIPTLPISPVITPIFQIIDLPKLKFPKQEKNKRSEMFDVEIRKGGIWGKATAKQLTKQQALDFGAFAVDRSTTASFRITKRSTRKIIPIFSNIDIGGTTGTFKKIQPHFYKKGKTFIESRRFRIDTEGEKLGLKKAKKKKRGFKLW